MPTVIVQLSQSCSIQYMFVECTTFPCNLQKFNCISAYELLRRERERERESEREREREKVCRPLNSLHMSVFQVYTYSGLLRHVRAAQCGHQTTPNMRSTGSTELPRFQVAGKLANCVRSTTSNSHSCGLRTCLRAKKH